jgi:phosphoglycerate dehydrogenase-like enzyme
MHVVGADPFVTVEAAAAAGITLQPFAEVLGGADVISLHSSLTDETGGIINRDTLALMKPGAGLVNFARGGLIESLDVLHEALVAGRLRGVALDAFDPEPPDVSHPIFKHERMIGTPHAAGNTPASTNNIFVSLTRDVAAVLSGERPRHCVNPEVFDR